MLNEWLALSNHKYHLNSLIVAKDTGYPATTDWFNNQAGNLHFNKSVRISSQYRRSLQHFFVILYFLI